MSDCWKQWFLQVFILAICSFWTSLKTCIVSIDRALENALFCLVTLTELAFKDGHPNTETRCLYVCIGYLPVTGHMRDEYRVWVSPTPLCVEPFLQRGVHDHYQSISYNIISRGRRVSVKCVKCDSQLSLYRRVGRWLTSGSITITQWRSTRASKNWIIYTAYRISACVIIKI